MRNCSTVLLVMRHVGNSRVLKDALADGGFATMEVSCEEELSAALNESDSPVIGLVDTSGFGSSVWRMFEVLRACKVRFVVLSDAGSERTMGQALASGAVSIFQKPVGKSPLLQLIRTLTQQF